MLMTFVCLKSAIIYWKLPNHSKCFLLKTSKPFSLCTSCAATLQGTFAEEGSFFNFWSASALWEVRSVNFTPVAVCAKSLIHEICLISSGVPAQSPPHSKSKHLGRWTVPGSTLAPLAPSQGKDGISLHGNDLGGESGLRNHLCYLPLSGNL